MSPIYYADVENTSAPGAGNRTRPANSWGPFKGGCFERMSQRSPDVPWQALQSQGLARFSHFIETHVFIHDDHWMNEDGDTDELSAHPTLARAPLVVTGRAPFQKSEAAEIIELPGPSPLSELLRSTEALDAVARKIGMDRLDISAFYSDRSELSTLQRLAQRYGYRPRVHPSPSDFLMLSSHVRNLARLRVGIEGYPPSEVATNHYDVDRHLPVVMGEAGVFIKAGDSRTVRAHSAHEVHEFADREGFPILMQCALDSSGTAVVHWFQDAGEVFPLFVSRQVTVNDHHEGNIYSPDFEDEFFERHTRLVSTWMALVPDWTGPIAVDVLLFGDGRLPVAIDLNARFNSSTFPMLYAVRSDPLAEWTYLRAEGNSETGVSTDAGVRHRFGASLAGLDRLDFTLSNRPV